MDNSVKTPFLLSIIATYHVQDLLVSNYEYNNGSTAETCLVTFTHNVQGFVESFTVGSKEVLISLSVSGNYTVKVYDIINGFIIGPSIEYKFEVQSRFILPPPPSIPITSSTAITVSGIIVYIFLTFYFSSSVYHTITFENTQLSIISMVLISTISIVIALLTVTVSIINFRSCFLQNEEKEC